MRALPLFFADIDDPRRRQGRRHPLPTVLAIATAATLCGMRGYKAMAEWADDLTQRARERFRCRRYDGVYAVPSESIIRNVLVRVAGVFSSGFLPAVPCTRGCLPGRPAVTR